MIRISIIAPAIAVRAGLRALFSDDPQINVIAEAAIMAEVADVQQEVDVMVWAPASSLGQAAILGELSTMKIEATAALLLVYHDPNVLVSLMRLPLRAWGFLDVESTQAELIASIQALHEGLSVANPVWLKQALMSPTISNHANDNLVESLTGRETEILQLLALGLTNKQIAARLKISAHTVKFHVSTIYSKLGTNNRVETVNLGLKKGLIVL